MGHPQIQKRSAQARGIQQMIGNTESRNRRTAYAIFRVTLGLNIFLHGFVRILTGSSAFEAHTEQLFTNTFLPAGQVHFFLSILPYIEAAVGSLIFVGLFTFWALVAGALLMLVLIFGTAARQDWTTVGIQTAYGLFYYFLISRNQDNWVAIDCLFANRRVMLGDK
jgi:thiosulfate dehydrogenase [quinone] large subunit